MTIDALADVHARRLAPTNAIRTPHANVALQVDFGPVRLNIATAKMPNGIVAMIDNNAESSAFARSHAIIGQARISIPTPRTARNSPSPSGKGCFTSSASSIVLSMSCIFRFFGSFRSRSPNRCSLQRQMVPEKYSRPYPSQTRLPKISPNRKRRDWRSIRSFQLLWISI